MSRSPRADTRDVTTTAHVDATHACPAQPVGLSPAAWCARAVSPPGADGEPARDRPIRVLFVESRATDAELVEAALCREDPQGFAVSRATCLAEGLQRAGAAAVDVLLVDLALTDAAGMAAFTPLRAAFPGLPIVILASDQDEMVAWEALGSGADDYVVRSDVAGRLLARALRCAIRRHSCMGRGTGQWDTDEHERTAEMITRKNTQLVQANALLSITMRELKQSWEELMEAEKLAALGRLAAGAAHELNNPLMGTLNYVQYCRERTAPDDPRYIRLQKAERELERCARIVTGMLASAHSHETSPAGHPEPIDCGQAVARAIDLLMAPARAEGLQVAVALPPDLPLCWADPDCLQQILVNLLTNATDAVAQAERKELRISAEVADDMVRLTVADTGCGMAPDTLRRLFDPFFTTKPVGKGTGLGMSICRNLVSKSGGKIEVASTPGRGTQVTVSLPSHPPTTSHARLPEETSDERTA